LHSRSCSHLNFSAQAGLVSSLNYSAQAGLVTS
jgi:hypothetical protein